MTIALPGDPTDLSEVGSDAAGLRAFLHGLPGVDEVGAASRAARLATRSIKKDAKAWAIDLAIRCTDLTTLEGADTPGKVRALCAKGIRPSAGAPSVAAICVYPDMVATAVEAVGDSGVKVAAVATAFPAGRSSREVKIADTRLAVDAGAHEIDMVIDRGAFLAGRYDEVFSEIVAVKQACGDAHLKVILETGELVTLDNVRRASWLALAAGADVIKTSTGKINPAATPTVSLVMMEAVRDLAEATGQMRGVKLAGGIRTTKEAIRYLVMLRETAGDAWLHPDLFRFGASSLVDDLLLQRQKLTTGAYGTTDRIPVA